MVAAQYQIDLGELEEFDAPTSIGLEEARQTIVGRGGRPANPEVVRRYTRLEHGCRPLGQHGPVIILPSVMLAGEYRFMRSWVEAFETARREAGKRQAKEPLKVRPVRSHQAAQKRAAAVLDAGGVRLHAPE